MSNIIRIKRDKGSPRKSKAQPVDLLDSIMGSINSLTETTNKGALNGTVGLRLLAGNSDSSL